MAILAASAYADHGESLRGAVAIAGRLAHLPRDVRAALLLSADGYPGAEIARHIGRRELATRSLICRHRSRLRESAAA